MRRVLQILGVLLALGLIYAIATGLGLTGKFKHRKDAKGALVLDDFEYTRDDFDWNTGGYVKVEPSTQNQTHGKMCAKATFLLSSQFIPVPTPTAGPAQQPTPTLVPAAAKPAPKTKAVPTPTEAVVAAVASPTPTMKWQPQMILDANSVTRLPTFEWQDYANLKLDVFNSQDHPVIYHLQIVDSKAFIYETSGTLTAKKVTNISVDLDALNQARLDLTNISGFHFWVDTEGETQPVVVYLDNLRLEGDAATAAASKKK